MNRIHDFNFSFMVGSFFYLTGFIAIDYACDLDNGKNTCDLDYCLQEIVFLSSVFLNLGF